MKRKDNMPDWVYWGLWGIRSRGAALGYCIGSLILAVALIIYGFKIGDLFFLMILLVPAWYWFALRWVDKNASWD